MMTVEANQKANTNGARALTGLRISIHFFVFDSVNFPPIRFFTVGCGAHKQRVSNRKIDETATTGR